jgi:hypothetical protein
LRVVNVDSETADGDEMEIVRSPTKMTKENSFCYFPEKTKIPSQSSRNGLSNGVTHVDVAQI